MQTIPPNPSPFMNGQQGFLDTASYEAAVEKYNVLTFGAISVFSDGVISRDTVDEFKNHLYLYFMSLPEGPEKALQTKDAMYEFVSNSNFNKAKLPDLVNRVEALTEAFHEVSQLQSK
jgi:hypothetical protein